MRATPLALAAVLMLGAHQDARAGASLFYEAEGGHSSNVDRVPGGRSSPYLRQTIIIGAETGGDDAFAAFTLRGAMETYGRAEDISHKDMEATLTLRGRLGEATAVSFQQTARIEDDEGLVSRRVRSVLELEHEIGALTLAPALQIERAAYDDLELDLGGGFFLILPGEDRNRVNLVGEFAATYELRPGLTVGPFVSVARRQMDLETDIFGRERGATTLLGGIEAGYKGVVDATLAVGYARRIYDEQAFSDVDALVVELEAGVPVGERGRLTFAASTEFEDDDLFLAKDLLTRRASLTYRHKLIGDLIGEAGVFVEKVRYLQAGASSTTRSLTAALEHPMGKNVALRASAERKDSVNKPFGPDGHEWRFGFGLVAQLQTSPARSGIVP